MARYLKESGAVVLDASDYGTLYKADMGEDEPIVMVEVTNSTPEPDGSFKHYTIRVDPTLERALDAVAWTFGMTGEEYAPLTQS